MTDQTIIEQAIELLARLEEIGGNEGGAFTLRSVGAVGGVFQQKLNTVLATLQSSLPSEALVEALERLEIASVGDEHGPFDYYASPLRTEINEALTAMRAATPTAPVRQERSAEEREWLEDEVGKEVWPDAPVQDDDAEWLRLHNMAYGFPAATAARLERIASRLSPTPETGLVEALREALETIKEHLDNDENFLAWEAANESLSNVSRLDQSE